MVGYGEDLPHGIFPGRLSRALVVPYNLLTPDDSLEDYVNLALHLSASAFRVELAAEPAPVGEPTESAPVPAPFREPTEYAPEPAPRALLQLKGPVGWCCLNETLSRHQMS